jgi:hypothetical protein
MHLRCLNSVRAAAAAAATAATAAAEPANTTTTVTDTSAPRYGGKGHVLNTDPSSVNHTSPSNPRSCDRYLLRATAVVDVVVAAAARRWRRRVGP